MSKSRRAAVAIAMLVALAVLPESIAAAVRGQIYGWSAGPLNALGTVGTVGLAWIVVGVLVIVRSIRSRSAGRAPGPAAGIEEQTIRP